MIVITYLGAYHHAKLQRIKSYGSKSTLSDNVPLQAQLHVKGRCRLHSGKVLQNDVSISFTTTIDFTAVVRIKFWLNIHYWKNNFSVNVKLWVWLVQSENKFSERGWSHLTFCQHRAAWCWMVATWWTTWRTRQSSWTECSQTIQSTQKSRLLHYVHVQPFFKHFCTKIIRVTLQKVLTIML